MRTYNIALSDGDTVGKDLMRQVCKVLRALESRFPVKFNISDIVSCGPAIEAYGDPLPISQADLAAKCNAIIIGNVGDPRYRHLAPEMQPTQALLELRELFNVCTNLRPSFIHPVFESFSPLKAELTAKGLDILIVRDLMGGMINGRRKSGKGCFGREASDLEYYNEMIIETSARLAFDSALKRKGIVTSVDKANVLDSSRLWRSKVCEISDEYSDIRLLHDYVDHTAMELIRNPSQFDVILTSNIFGDILADEVAQLCGTPWLFGSAELAADFRGIYTPNQLHHPKSLEYENTGRICPYGIINAAAMMLHYSCGRQDLAQAVERAVEYCIRANYVTEEAENAYPPSASCDELGDRIAHAIVSQDEQFL